MAPSSSSGNSASRFSAYAEALVGALVHADRITPVRRCCAGLLLMGERKSIEPMPAQLEPGRVQATFQSLHHLLAVARARVLPAIQQHGPAQAWIIDDTGSRKKGSHPVGVARQFGIARQYCGPLGQQENCQLAASLPAAWRPCLPQLWPEHAARASKAGVPAELGFTTRPKIAPGHYGGRGWREFRHHTNLCIAAYGCLIVGRVAIPPSAAGMTPFIQAPLIPKTHRPRGAADPA